MGMGAIERGSATNYSIARGMGSLGYSVLAYITGFLVRQQGVKVVPAVAAAVAVMMIGSVIWFYLVAERNLPDYGPSKQKTEYQAGFLKQYPRFAVFLVAMILLPVGGVFLGVRLVLRLLRRTGKHKVGRVPKPRNRFYR